MARIEAYILLYYNFFAFSLEDLEGYKGKSIHIQLKDDYSIF
uniref:Uncharacterized protein n=1 Tax=Physcomitrium patens TaxID=3218 RepID=A0A2K1KJF8_PHYPA|nr:hypothetical protein PHYPA_007586 [Physcomitrium patens]